MSAKVTASDLDRIITNAAIFASRDSNVPIINAVQLESSESHLTAVGTDRFTLGASTAEYLDGVPGEHFSMTLRLAQAQNLARIARSCRQAFSDVAIDVGDEAATFRFSSGEAFSLPKTFSDATFPDWRKLIKGYTANDDVPASLVGMNPQYMAKFARVHDARKMLVKVGPSARPSLISIGGQFVGVIMPVRIEDSVWVFPQWIDRPEPKPVAPKRVRRARKAS